MLNACWRVQVAFLPEEQTSDAGLGCAKFLGPDSSCVSHSQLPNSRRASMSWTDTLCRRATTTPRSFHWESSLLTVYKVVPVNCANSSRESLISLVPLVRRPAWSTIGRVDGSAWLQPSLVKLRGTAP